MTAEDWETKYREAWERFKVERIETLRLKDRMSHKQERYIAREQEYRKTIEQIEKDIAAFIKKEFDKKYNPTWHCIVGRNFGSYVTHETKHFIYFYLGQVAILLFKSG